MEGYKRSIDVVVTLQFQNVIDGTTRMVKKFKRTQTCPDHRLQKQTTPVTAWLCGISPDPLT